MRTIIEIPDTQIEQLMRFAVQEKISRAELIRRAVADYLQRYNNTAGDDAFGLWAARHEDGLAYQERLRGEWD
ncbi:MAG: CopG family transcriptional regulator [Thiothrix lacustris]|uniref:CopG family transcriptional regulator n=1 Tax=Thiothrix lacustris TaxID=525917 RepID=A0A1Y1QQ05_9GAMM|nr:MAG: CopG family transcriptional regulator [Thiothrix lacustris]